MRSGRTYTDQVSVQWALVILGFRNHANVEENAIGAQGNLGKFQIMACGGGRPQGPGNVPVIIYKCLPILAAAKGAELVLRGGKRCVCSMHPARRRRTNRGEEYDQGYQGCGGTGDLRDLACSAELSMITRQPSRHAACRDGGQVGQRVVSQTCWSRVSECLLEVQDTYILPHNVAMDPRVMLWLLLAISRKRRGTELQTGRIGSIQAGRTTET